MGQNSFSQMQDERHSKLHMLPFIIIWCSAYAMSWLSGAASLLLGDIVASNFDLGWFDYPPMWFQYLAVGLVFGITLAIMQTWAIRRRYNFVPRFFGLATIIATMMALYATGMLWDNYSSYQNPFYELSEGLLWFGILSSIQSLVLFRVNRQAWLLILIGIASGAIAGLITYADVFRYDGELIAALVGTTVQSIATALAMLRLMAHPREGIVPKRDAAEKAKTSSRQGMSAFTFIVFYACAYLIGWGTLMVLNYLYGASDLYRYIRDYEDWIYNWRFGILLGLVAGIAPIVAQRWLMRQYCEVNLLHWRILTAIGYAIAGIGLYFYITEYRPDNVERFIYLATWFVTPALLQTIATWRALHGGWLWIATGFAATVIAIMISAQAGNRWEGQVLAITFGAIAQAIITGVTYVLLSSQQRETEKPKAVLEA